MTSFRPELRQMRDERVERTQTHIPSGKGFMWCKRSSQRYATTATCPACFPSRGHYRVR